MSSSQLLTDLAVILSNPYVSPANLVLMCIAFIVGFYGTFANAFVSITLFRAQSFEQTGEQERKRDTPILIILSVFCSILIPTLVLLFGFYNELPFFIALGSIYFVMAVLGIYAGMNTRMDILRESGYSFDSDTFSNLSIFLKFPTGTWENEVSYVISYSERILKKLAVLYIILVVIGFFWPYAEHVLKLKRA